LHDLLQNDPVDEIAPRIWHWKAVHPNLGIEVSSYWLPDLKLLLDPIAVPDDVDEVEHILLSCLDGAVVPYEVGGLSPDETALHIPPANALSIADGAIRYGDDLGFVPDQYMDDPDKDKADLKRGFGRLADELDFDVLLLAHGEPYPSGGREELRRFSES
jgi:glyoxylase-like metal-dependent hydrolase (beta-lactamase superfamily II)